MNQNKGDIIVKLKKLFAGTLAAAVMLSGTQALAYANTVVERVPYISGDSDTLVADNYQYVILDNNTAVLKKYLGSSVNIVIPSEIDGHEVSGLSGTFNGVDTAESIVSITVPGTVKTIGYATFAQLSALQTILFPDTLETIGDHAFRYCTSLEEVRIPSSVNSIGEYAFYGCENLRNVVIPDSVTQIGFVAFEETPWLTNYLNDYVIVGDEILICYKGSDQHAEIPDGVKKIGDGAFSVAELRTDKGSFTNTYITSVSIPDTVTYIGDYAFSRNKISSINISRSVKTVGANAFRFTNIDTVTLPFTVESWGSGVFTGCENLKTVNVTEGTKGAFNEDMFRSCSSLETINIPDGTTEIGAHCFAYCTSLKNVTLNDGLKKIGEEAFYHCEALDKITIPATVDTLETDVFGSCDTLSRVDFPGRNTGWDGSLFTWTYGVTVYCYTNSEAHKSALDDKLNIVLYDGTDTDTYTDINTDSDEDISTDEDNIKDYEYTEDETSCVIIKYNGSEKSVVMPDEINGKPVVTIAEGAFSGNQTIEEVFLPEPLKTIEANAFSECTALKEVNFNEYTETILDGAFAQCTALETISIPENTTTLGTSVFLGCESLEDAEILGKIDYIGPAVFLGCYNLTYLTIADSVKEIEPAAFTGCDNIEIVYCNPGSAAEAFAQAMGIDTAPIDDEDNEPSETDTNTEIDYTDERYAAHLRVTSNDVITDYDMQYDPEQDAFVCDYIPKEGDTVYFYITKDGLKLIGSEETAAVTGISSDDDAVGSAITLSPFKLFTMYPDDSATDTATDTADDTSSEIYWTVTFDSNGGNEVEPVKVKDGERVTSAVVPQREGYRFINWYLGDAQFKFYNTPITGDITLTAKWEKEDSSDTASDTDTSADTSTDAASDSDTPKKYTVTFDSNGGSSFTPVTVYGGSYISEPIPQRYGYTFVCWNRGDEEYDFLNTPVTEDMTLVAQWQKTDVSDTNTDTSGVSTDTAADTPTDTETISYLGDVNGDKKVTAKDSMQIQRYVVNLVKLGDEQIKLADVDGNNKVTNADALNILRYTININVKYPIGQDYSTIDFSQIDKYNYTEFDFHGLKFKKMGDVFKYKTYSMDTMGYKDGKFYFNACDTINGENVLFRVYSRLPDELYQAYYDVVKGGAYAHDDVFNALKDAPITQIVDYSDKIPSKSFLDSLKNKSGRELNDMGFKVSGVNYTGRETFVTYDTSGYRIRVYFNEYFDYKQVLPFDDYFENYTVGKAEFEMFFGW